VIFTTLLATTDIIYEYARIYVLERERERNGVEKLNREDL
jgi:hypothetical protein